MTRQRTIADRLPNLPRKPFPFAEERAPEWTPTYRLDRLIAEAKAEMGEARWAELNAEWEQGQ